MGASWQDFECIDRKNLPVPFKSAPEEMMAGLLLLACRQVPEIWEQQQATLQPKGRQAAGRAALLACDQVCRWASPATYVIGSSSMTGSAPGHALPGLLVCPHLPHACLRTWSPSPSMLVPALRCIQLLPQSCTGLAHAHSPSPKIGTACTWCARALSPPPERWPLVPQITAHPLGHSQTYQ